MKETPLSSATSTPDAAAVKPPEQRKAYGSAKTENLRDSGLWRVLLPGFVALCCLAIVFISLVIPAWLLYDSLSGSATGGLTWLWIVMILIIIGITAVIVRGLTRIFMTQAGNY
jgi:hypothetical protein